MPAGYGKPIDISNLSINAIPYRDENGNFVDSGFYLENGILIAKKDLEIPPNTLHLGANISIHENGGFVEIHTETLNKNYILPMGENADNGSLIPFYYKRDAIDTRAIFQSDYSETMSNVTTLSIPAVADYEVSRIYGKFVDEVTNFKMKLEVNGNDVAYYPSKNAWEDNTVDGYDMSSGESYFDMDPHFSFLTSYAITAYVKADQEINMLGNGVLPWLAIDKKDMTKQYIVMDVTETETFLNNANKSLVIGADTVCNATIIYYLSDTTTYEGGVIVLVSDGTTAEIDVERIGELDVIIDDIDFSTSIADSNLCLDIAATGDGSKTVTFKYKINTIE